MLIFRYVWKCKKKKRKSDYILHTRQQQSDKVWVTTWLFHSEAKVCSISGVTHRYKRFLFWATPLVSPTGLHCQSNHVFSTNPFKAYMYHHHWVQEWNYTMTKLFSLAHKASWFGNIRREERKGCERKHCTAFVVAHESSYSCNLAKWAHLFEIISWHLNFEWCEWLVLKLIQHSILEFDFQILRLPNHTLLHTHCIRPVHYNNMKNKFVQGH